MDKTNVKHFDGSRACNSNAIFHFINSNRNFGKTWAFKKRAFKRALKRGKKTIWIRRFEEEAKECALSFYTSKDLQRFCGIEPYNKETKTGNFKQEGRRFYVKRGKQWEMFLQVVALSNAGSMRGVDDISLDTIIFDEYRTTPEKYTLFRGNEVTQFIDIFFSVKREHQVKCFFLGNRESENDPYMNYFGIPPAPRGYEGVRRYRNGTIYVQYINNIQNRTQGDYDTQLEYLFSNTSYGNYIYKNQTKDAQSVSIRKPPTNSIIYFQLLLGGHYISILTRDGHFYCKSGADRSKLIYSDRQTDLRNHLYLSKRLKKFFPAFENAIVDRRVHYESDAVYEQVLPFIKWLGI